MNKVMKWKYKGTPDIVFGEIKESKAPKIILFSIIGLIACICITGFLFRNYLYDLVFNPHIEFNNLVKVENGEYFIDLDLNSEFDKNAYIDSARTLKYDKFISDNNKYVCEVFGELNTKIIGEYEIIYNSSNRIKSQEVPVIVRVSDNTSPTIELTKKADTINRTDESIKTFNPEDYIKSATDNYYDTTIEYHIYDADNNTEVSKEDIQSMYISLEWLDILPDDVDAYANELIGSDVSKEESLLINEDLYAWGENWLQARDKYKSDIKNQIESNHRYIIEYIITENSENAYTDTTQIEFVITFDENSIVDKLNTNKDKLIELGVLSDIPDATETTKPTGHSGNNNQTLGSGNEDNKPSNTGDDKPETDTGNNNINQPTPWDNDAVYTVCPKCGEIYNQDEEHNCSN